MNQKQARLVVGAVALIFGAGAIIGMKKIMNKPTVVIKPQATTGVKVLVASSNIALGDVVKANHFRWMEWPANGVSSQYIRYKRMPGAPQKFAGSIARMPIMAGEPISPRKLIKAGQGGVLASILPAGKRAISTTISEQSAAGQLILPNDHVDVLLTRRVIKKGGGTDISVDTLFRNIRVLAIGQIIEAKDNKTVEAKTATLELTPLQAQQLVQANAMGKISLALRSVADFGEMNGPAVNAKTKDDEGAPIKVLRYGVSSRKYGVN